MKPKVLDFTSTDKSPLYIQLYNQIKDEILTGGMASGEKLPSLRKLSAQLDVSMTTSELAYNQLLVEGYIISKPQSGFYVAEISSLRGNDNPPSSEKSSYDINEYTMEDTPFLYDLSCFDFNKWKKCAAKVFNDYSHLLLFESDPQGEAALRFEIAKYVYSSRGVSASPDQIVIGAGTQQITGHLSKILMKLNVKHVSIESPGYLPVQSMFTDAGFSLSHIPVASQDGIDIGRLPTNIPSAVYVSPSNQFPTGAVMPVGKRYELLKWAEQNSSYIIEDDYDSELRYFGKTIPALQGLDKNGRVVYLGSFSSTLFPAIKISYMVLPQEFMKIFNSIKNQYTQTCSKAEQLTLAFFMEDGHYYTGIKKQRKLYSQKLSLTLQTFSRCGRDLVQTMNTQSGISLTLNIKSPKSADQLSAEARSLGLDMVPLSRMTDAEAGEKSSQLSFYYNHVPIANLEKLIEEVIALWKNN